MNKEDYFQISERKKLPNRCPILNKCSRRAWTIYLFNRLYETDPYNNFILRLIQEGEIPKDFEETMVRMQGEIPGGSLGRTSGSFNHTCPEVNLFDDMNAFGFFKGTACTSGSFDTESKPQSRIYEERHYSECAEFAKFSLDNKAHKSPIHYAYLMYDDTHQLFKIGHSNSPKYRERTLQGKQPKVELLEIKKFQSKKDAVNLETELHLKYKDKQIRGEWFDLDSSEVEEIKEIFASDDRASSIDKVQ